MKAAGFVLVGGKSSRMGRDKALLPGRSGSLAGDVAEAVKAVTGNVTLIGDPTRYGELNYPCLPDLRPALGPLAGLEAALTSTTARLNLVLACDTPDVTVSQLQTLLDRASESNAPCVATKDGDGQVHPLPAVYTRDCLPVVQRRLDEKMLSLIGLLAELHSEYLVLDSTLQNINTPTDWENWNLNDERKGLQT